MSRGRGMEDPTKYEKKHLKNIELRNVIIFSNCFFFTCRRSLYACSSKNVALVYFPFSDPFAVSRFFTAVLPF
jgi:hypothetical protein